MRKKLSFLLLLVLIVSTAALSVACGGKQSNNQLAFTFNSYDYGTTVSEPVVTLEPLSGTAVYTYEGRDGTVYASSSAKPTAVGKYTVTGKVEATKTHKEISLSVDFEIYKGTLSSVLFPSGGNLVYGDTLSNSALTGGSDSGTFAWADGTIVPTVINGGYDVVFTPTDTNYKTEIRKVDVTVSKKVVTQITFPTVDAITYSNSKTLNTLELVGGDITYGRFSWAVPSDIPTVAAASATGYKMLFVPDDKDNYDYTAAEGYNATTKKVEKYVKFTVNKAAGPALVAFPTNLELDYGMTLADCGLPTAAGGEFSWSDDSVKPSNGNTYELIFTADRTNYDWSGYTGTGSEALSPDGTITKNISITVNKIKAVPADGFIKEHFIAVPSILKSKTTQYKISDFAGLLPEFYSFLLSEGELSASVALGKPVSVKTVYNPDPNNYFNSDPSFMTLYIECGETIQRAVTTGENANIVTADLGSMNQMLKDQPHNMMAPETLIVKNSFVENDTINIKGTSQVAINTLVNFIWKTSYLYQSNGKYVNANVRFYLRNNADFESNMFVAANGGVKIENMKKGKTVVLDLFGDGKLNGESFYWGLNGDPAFNMDGTGSFIGRVGEVNLQVLYFAMPFMIWTNDLTEAVLYDFDVSLIVDPAVESGIEGQNIALGQADILTPTKLNLDDGSTVDGHILKRDTSWAGKWVETRLGTVGELLDMEADKNLVFRGYVYTMQCDEPGSNSVSVAGDNVGYHKTGNRVAFKLAKDASGWIESLSTDKSIGANCYMLYGDKKLKKDETGFYYMTDAVRTDVTEEEARTAIIVIYVSISGSPFDSVVLFTQAIEAKA